MKIRSVFILAVIPLLLTGCQQRYPDHKGKLFIIGGGEKSDEMLHELILLAGIEDIDYIYVLPMASSVPDSSVIWVRDDFRAICKAKVTGHNFLPGEVPDESALDSVKKAKLIYLSGGDQSRFMSAVLNSPLKSAIAEAYRCGSVIAGTSAGAAVMSKRMITGNQKKHPGVESGFKTIESENIEITEGLGLLDDVIIDQHFIKRERLNRLIAVSIENPGNLCTGIDESTAIIVDGDIATVTGLSQVIVIKNTGGEKIVRNGLLGTEGLQLKVYLPGQSFNLR